MAEEKDKFPSMTALLAQERPGIDYRMSWCRGLPTALVAPHGGKIEPGTSELAKAIAADRYSYFSFEGIKSSHNHDLHVTSTHYDEPHCLELLAACDIVVTLHGCRDVKGMEGAVYPGGLDDSLRDAIRDALNKSGFKTGERSDLQGVDKQNICNRGRSRKGVQLEISRSLRDKLVAGSPSQNADFAKFIAAVQSAIAAASGGH